MGYVFYLLTLFILGLSHWNINSTRAMNFVVLFISLFLASGIVPDTKYDTLERALL